MAEPLSVVASSFAVVGLADVVIRAGNQVYQFLSAIKDVPAEVEKLQISIRDNIVLAENSKAHWEESRQLVSSLNPAAITPLNKTLPQFKSALDSLKRELSALVILTKRYKGVPHIWGRVKFVFDDRKIQRSLQRLEASKSNLVIALVLVGRQQDLLSQKGFERNIQEAFRQMTVSTESRIHKVERQIEEGARVGQASLEDATSRWNRQTNTVRSDIVDTNQNILQQHKETRAQLAQETTNAVNIICSKFDNLSQEIVRARNPAERSGRNIWFYGNNREDILCPLLLLRPEFQRAIFGILSRQSELFSAQDLYHLLSEFESLVISATQEVAAVSHGSTATSFDDWIYPQRLSSSLKRVAPQNTLVSMKRSRNHFILTSKETSSNKAEKKRRRLSPQSFSFELPIGTLEIIIPRPTVTSLAMSEPSKIREVGFSFLPRSSICSTCLHGYFVIPTDVQAKPCLYAQLNAFNVFTDWDNEKRDILLIGTLEEIDSAFRSGKMSPYDVHQSGVNDCLFFSAIAGRVDVFQYLDNQGIGIQSLKDRRSAFEGLMVSITVNATPNNINDEDFISMRMDANYRVLEYLKEKDAIDVLTNLHYLMILIQKAGPYNCSDSVLSMTKHLFKALKEEEYDFEQGVLGLTPLAFQLAQCGPFSLEMVRNLLECGANAHAICLGWNMFFYAMINSKRESCRRVLEEKFCLVIRAGVDVNFVDEYGMTPSKNSVGAGCCVEWCRALESCHLDIFEVLDMDKKRHKRFWAQRMADGALIIDESIQAYEKTRQPFSPTITREGLVDIAKNAEIDEERWQIFEELLPREPPLTIEKFWRGCRRVNRSERCLRCLRGAARKWAQDLTMEEQCQWAGRDTKDSEKNDTENDEENDTEYGTGDITENSTNESTQQRAG